MHGTTWDVFPSLLTALDEPIVLINDTPDVEINEVAGTATVRVDFTLRSDVVRAECSLGTGFPPTDCKGPCMRSPLYCPYPRLWLAVL